MLNTDRVGAYLTNLTCVSTIVQPNARLIGQPRIARLMADCDGDNVRAARLYDWNVRAAGAYFSVLHVFEVILRNAMDRELRLWNSSVGSGSDWLLTPDPRLRKLLHTTTLSKALTRANQTARAANRPVMHDDVLAQMTMATWRFMLPSNSSTAKQRLWTAALHKAFPRWRSNWPPLVARVEAVHEFRNRVAHLEPIHNQDLTLVRRSVRQIAHAIDYDAGRLIVQADYTHLLGAELRLLMDDR